MFCTNCGAENKDDAKFCVKCGETLVESQVPVSPPTYIVTQKVSSLRHPKEEAFFILGAVVGGIAWLLIIWLVILFFWLAIPIAIFLWILDQSFRAKLLGNSIRVSHEQYPEIYEIVDSHSKAVNLKKPPSVFIVNSQGAINAFAVKFLKDKYIILFSDLVDLMLAHGSTKELSSIIGHEIGHHAAGHTAWWKQILLKPAMILPFFGAAYSRACELTADRIALYLCGDKDATHRGLIALACGSKLLGPKTSVEAFKQQENLLSPVFAFFHDLYSSHPRITKRVLALEDATQLVNFLATRQ